MILEILESDIRNDNCHGIEIYYGKEVLRRFFGQRKLLTIKCLRNNELKI